MVDPAGGHQGNGRDDDANRRPMAAYPANRSDPASAQQLDPDERNIDAVVDFDAAVRDSARPARLLQRFNPGDDIHPNDPGNAAMAAAVDIATVSQP